MARPVEEPRSPRAHDVPDTGDNSTTLETTLTRRVNDLERDNRELELFAHRVAHDLKAPLRAVDGFSQMLEEDYGPRLDDEARRLLGTVRQNAQRMAKMLDDLLAFSRAGQHTIHRTEVDIGALARVVAAQALDVANRRGVDLRIGVLPPVQADRELLRTVLEQLVSNALKFTARRDHPLIEIGHRTDAGEDTYFVRDNGAGFDMGYVDRLFQPFERLHYPDEFPGVGMGLALAARIVERHGGRIWATAAPDAGATVSFTIPPLSDAP